MRIKYLTGEMARLHNISKQTLIYYDKIGLFKPSTTSGENGYRYYTLDQFGDLDVILCLKKLGMTLDEIKKYQNQKSSAERIAILESQEDAINRKIEDINSTKNHLEFIVGTLKSRLTTQPFKVGVRWIPERRIIKGSIDFPHDKHALGLGIKRFFEDNRKQFYMHIHELMVWIHFLESGEEKYMSIGFEVEGEQREILPAGLYGYIYHKGFIDNMNQSHKKLKEHIEASGFKVAGECIGKMILGSLAVSSRNEYIIEIQIPV